MHMEPVLINMLVSEMKYNNNNNKHFRDQYITKYGLLLLLLLLS